MLLSNYDEPWQAFHTPVVRQLAFAIASPNLISHFPADLPISSHIIEIHPQSAWRQYFDTYLPRLIFLDQHPQELIDFLARIKSTRLGLRFEALLWFWLQDNNQHFDLLGHSIQHHADGKTLGEIDFLLRNKQTHQIEHWEVCLKYYLAESTLRLDSWIGLNPNDTLEQKLIHLRQKQFQFDIALNFPIEKRYVIIKGQFYLPSKHATLPDWINHQRRLGLWLSHIPDNGQWRRLNRQEWLCPFAHHISDPISPIWWTNGLYYNHHAQQYLMLRLFYNLHKLHKTANF